MRFYDSLYTSKSIGNPENAKRRLFFGIGCSFLPQASRDFYVISLARNADQLDIFSASLLKQRCFDKKSLIVVGIASDRQEAVGLVELMLGDAFRAGMVGDIKGYLLGEMARKRRKR